MRISDWSSDVCSSDLRDRVGFAIIAVAFRHLQSCEIGQYRVGTEASRDPGQKSRAPARDSDRFRMPRGGEAGRPETGMPRLCLGKPLEDAPNRRVALGPGERTVEMGGIHLTLMIGAVGLVVTVAEYEIPTHGRLRHKL